MSRWREMMMDYGQIFGSDNKSVTSSNVFSIGSDLKDKRNADLQFRRTLEVHFRPLFQRFVYGGEKIACHDLRRLLYDPEYRDRLPADKIQELADVADFNKGKAITYTEFVNIVLNQLPVDDLASQGSLDDLSSQQGMGPAGTAAHSSFLAGFLRNTTTQKMVEDKLTHYRCCPPPVFMILLTLVQVIVYIAMNAAEDVPMEALEGVAKGNDIMYLPTRRREVWRWITYCLLHQGFVDLMINVVLQVFLGIPLEMMFSWWRVAFVYVAGVAVGSCSHSMFDRPTGLVGAGGGSLALVGAHIVVLALNWKRFNDDPTESLAKKSCCSVLLRLIVLVVIVITQLVLAVYRRWFLKGIGMEIGIGAHLGGLGAGLFMGDAFFTNHNESPCKRGAALFGVFALCIAIGVAIIFNIVSNDFPLEDYS